MAFVVLKHKDSSVGNFAAVVPEGVSEEEVVEAWSASGWSKASKAAQESAAELNPAAATDPAAS